jgi:hypothetical protein
MMIKCTFDGGFHFNKIHGFRGLQSKYPSEFYEDKGKTLNGTKYWLFIDVPETIQSRKSEVKLAKEQEIKIISLFYDEARFPFVDRLVSENLIDMFILFDKRYQDRFPVTTHISDFYLSETVFPPLKKERNGKQCYFGHKLYGRTFPPECEHIKGGTLNDVYNIASTYSKGYVTSEGRGENGQVAYQNKAKYLEMLFCGLQVICQNGIETLNYEQYKDKPITEGDLENMRKTNDKVRKDIFEKITSL